MTLSLFSSSSIEEINRGSPSGLRWQHLYIFKDKQCTAQHIRQADQKGLTGLVITVDTVELGRRRLIAKPGFFKGLSIPLISPKPL